jgi:hypothetical protein
LADFLGVHFLTLRKGYIPEPIAEPIFANNTILWYYFYMSSYSTIERNQQGHYWRIQQHFDSADLPDGGTVVGFDSVSFARSTGQIAIIGVARYAGLSNGATYVMLDNRDNRWSAYGSVTPKGVESTIHSVGTPIVDALVEHHGIPVAIAGALSVTQEISEISDCTFISDGPMNLTSSTREEGFLPSRETDIALQGDTLVVGDMQAYPEL